MPITQDERLLSINTPLGKDYLLLSRITGTESLSRLFLYDVELLHEETDEGFKPTAIDPASIIGQGVAIGIQQEDGTIREIAGIVNTFSQGSRNSRYSFYHATIVPHIWVLTQRIQSRIFQTISVLDILRQLFEQFEVSWQVQGNPNKRNYCVQYRESDWAFANRLMEEEGYYYFFEHKDGKHKLVVANTPQSHLDCPSKSTIEFYTKLTEGTKNETSIHTWTKNYNLQTGKVTFRDFNFQLPTNKHEYSETSVFPAGGNDQLELYDYPGGFARKYDGIDRSGGEQASELQKIHEDKSQTVRTKGQSLDAQTKTVHGVGDCASMTAGYAFTLTNHPNSSDNAKYVITSVTHQADQSPTYLSDETLERAYANTFTCIQHGAGCPPFRPPQITPKPKIYGSQTAFVVGPAGEEIFTDKYGRVKVQFHWDREGQTDASSSCWVRVSHGWAGNKWGMIHIPRIGMEVVVHFLEGDPDQPLITGCVYSPSAMPPYILPDEKTKSTMKSDSTKGGGGFNEFRFEDKKGAEQIFIHGEKNQDVRIKNDSLEFVGHDRHLIIANDQFEIVKKDKHLKVTGNQNEKIDGSISVNAGIDIDKKAGTKFAVEAGTEIHLKSGTSLTLETGTSLTLKVGGNFININSAGVFIKGTMVFLNSGGAAGSGSGSNPDPPKEAKEADRAEPGTRPQPPTALAPPPRPVFRTSTAITLLKAAEDGVPFCEICSRG